MNFLKWRMIILFATGILVGYLLLINRNYRTQLELAQHEKNLQKNTLATQQAFINEMRKQDRLSRELTAAQQQKEQLIRQHTMTLERKFKDAIKTIPCAAEPLPDAVTGLLREAAGTPAGAGSDASP